jgi:hypothetical protein
MQHLISKDREEDVKDETATEIGQKKTARLSKNIRDSHSDEPDK